MKKCVSTSLFIQQSGKYSKAYLVLPISMSKLLPGFDLVIYHDQTVPNYMIEEYKKYDFVKLIKKPLSVKRSGCFWRYEAYDSYDLCLFRDIDVGIEENDVFVIKEFLKRKQKIAWIFLAHGRSAYPKQGFILGGVFLMKKSDSIPSMRKLVEKYPNHSMYGADEIFLSKCVYPLERPVVFVEPRSKIKNVMKYPEFETYVYLENNFKLKHYNIDC